MTGSVSDSSALPLVGSPRGTGPAGAIGRRQYYRGIWRIFSSSFRSRSTSTRSIRAAILRSTWPLMEQRTAWRFSSWSAARFTVDRERLPAADHRGRGDGSAQPRAQGARTAPASTSVRRAEVVRGIGRTSWRGLLPRWPSTSQVRKADWTDYERVAELWPHVRFFSTHV